MNTEIKAGCLYQGVFYPSGNGIKYGYLHNGRFQDLLESTHVDFGGMEGAEICLYTEATNEYQLLSREARLGYSFKGRFYNNTKDILLTSMAEHSVYRTKCVICKDLKGDCQSIQGKQVCISCLVIRLRSQCLYFEERDARVNWTEKAVHEAYQAVIKAGRKSEIPAQCPLPCESVICCGRSVPVADDYPSHGHIIGVHNQCIEGGCPRHTLCFNCADRLFACPLCNYRITYEMPPTQCTCGMQLCYGFSMECPGCGKRPGKRKQPTTFQD